MKYQFAIPGSHLDGGHSLRGLCGLKLPVAHLSVFLLASQPARAVWIEIRNMGYKRLVTYSHSLRGLCGLKSLKKMARISYLSHSLRGLCGLKLQHFSHAGCRLSSQPARAVWIEISSGKNNTRISLSHSLRGLCGLKYIYLL